MIGFLLSKRVCHAEDNAHVMHKSMEYRRAFPKSSTDWKPSILERGVYDCCIAFFVLVLNPHKIQCALLPSLGRQK